MGDGSTATSIWHQDAQSTLARARHHFPRFLIGFYFPHEVTTEMGLTRFLIASHCGNGPDLNRAIYQPQNIRAGTFVLAHFDIAHAGFPNVSHDDRFILKFVFARTRQPTKPIWSNERDVWRTIDDASFEQGLYESAASFIWNRMCGRINTERGTVRTSHGLPKREVQQDKRLRAIYGATVSLSVQDCVEALKRIRGKKKQEIAEKPTGLCARQSNPLE